MSKRVKIIVYIVLALVSFVVLLEPITSARYLTDKYYQVKEMAETDYDESDTLQEEYSSFSKYWKDVKEGNKKYYYYCDDSGPYSYYGISYNHYDHSDIEQMRWAWAVTLIGTFGVPAVFLLLSTLLVAFLNFIYSRPELVLTDKRLYGKNTMGRRVDLPIDSITSISTIKLSKGLKVATSSGAIKFRYLSNVKDFHKELSNLLIERQNDKKVNETENVGKENTSSADELKKYKELLDMGAVTQEEFDAKKKQLLGL